MFSEQPWPSGLSDINLRSSITRAQKILFMVRFVVLRKQGDFRKWEPAAF